MGNLLQKKPKKPTSPWWGKEDEALYHIAKALEVLIDEGDYLTLRALTKIATRLQKSIDKRRAKYLRQL